MVELENTKGLDSGNMAGFEAAVLRRCCEHSGTGCTEAISMVTILLSLPLSPLLDISSTNSNFNAEHPNHYPS